MERIRVEVRKKERNGQSRMSPYKRDADRDKIRDYNIITCFLFCFRAKEPRLQTPLPVYHLFMHYNPPLLILLFLIFIHYFLLTNKTEGYFLYRMYH